MCGSQAESERLCFTGSHWQRASFKTILGVSPCVLKATGFAAVCMFWALSAGHYGACKGEPRKKGPEGCVAGERGAWGTTQRHQVLGSQHVALVLPQVQGPHLLLASVLGTKEKLIFSFMGWVCGGDTSRGSTSCLWRARRVGGQTHLGVDSGSIMF